MKKIFTLIAVAAMAFAAQAAELTVCDGTTTGEYAPVYGYNFETDQHNQMQYPSTELTGLAAGTEITAMKFYTSTPDEVNALGGTVTVSLANIDEVTPWSPDAWGGVTGNLLDVEVTAVATLAPAVDADGVWTITFDAPFTYTGNALLVDVQSVAGDYNNTAFYGKEVGSYLVMSTYGYAGSKKGQTLLPKTTFTYEDGGQGGETTVDLLSEANALEDNAEFTFNGDAVVTVCMNGYLFLRDESGYAQIKDFDGTLEPGQVLNSGWTATKTTINAPWVRYINAAGISASDETNAELAKAVVLTGAPDENLLNAYVCVENVTTSSGGGFPGLPQRYFVLPDNSKLFVTDYLWAHDWDAGNYNVYGIICLVDGKLKMQPIEFEPYEEPTFLRGDVNDDGVVDIADVTALIDYLLVGDASTINLDAANCNLDEEVDIADVTVLIDYLLNKTWD